MNLGTYDFPRPKPGRHAPYPWAALTAPGSFFLVRTPRARHHYSSPRGNTVRETLACGAKQFRRNHDPAARFAIRWGANVILVVERVA